MWHIEAIFDRPRSDPQARADISVRSDYPPTRRLIADFEAPAELSFVGLVTDTMRSTPIPLGPEMMATRNYSGQGPMNLDELYAMFAGGKHPGTLDKE